MTLVNLVKINKLKAEPPDQKEFDGMVRSAKRRLQDAKIESLSEDGQFSLSIYCDVCNGIINHLDFENENTLNKMFKKS